MLKIRSISARLVLAISILIAANCAVLGTFSALQQRTMTRLALDQQLKLQYDSVIAALDYEGRAAFAVSSVIAALPSVADAVAKGDRGAMMALLGGIAAPLKAQGMPFIDVIQPPATVFLRVHDPKAFGDDASAHRTTVVLSNKTGDPVVGVEPARTTLAVFAMTPMMRDGKSIGVIDIGVPFGKEFVDRAKQRFDVDIAVHRFENNEFRKLAATYNDAAVATQDEMKSVFDGTTLRRDAWVDGHPAALYLGQIKNYAGKPVAVIEVINDTTQYEAVAANAQRNFILGTAVILAIGVLLALFLGRGLSRPLVAITATMNRLSSGDTAVTIPGSARRDELGVMASAVQVFKDSMIETERLKAEQEISKQRAEQDRRNAVLNLADKFESGVGGIVESVAAAATELQSTARTMAAMSEETTRQSSTVAAASEQATANVHTVASATEQLSASIKEMSERMTHSSDMIQEAVAQANKSNEEVHSLNTAAQKIGDVVKLISDIASQTNLLALNATIESAGEAGKGFAVVASEVKILASQTAQATEQVGVQIKAMQEAAQRSASSIQAITDTIRRVNETAATIAAAVEEQGAATQEIARNVSQAAHGTQEVTSNIGGVSQAASQNGQAAAHMLTAAGELSANGDLLKSQVDAFLNVVRAA
jgi:methyl-accepting chemotaxis protein